MLSTFAEYHIINRRYLRVSPHMNGEISVTDFGSLWMNRVKGALNAGSPNNGSSPQQKTRA